VDGPVGRKIAMLNVHELNVFIEAALAQNFSVAAQRLCLSQPAVSLHIRNLEKQLGVDLFERKGRKISLSETGKIMLPLAQEAVRKVRQIEEAMRSLQGKVIGDLSIACSTTVGKYILPRLVAGFRSKHPDVHVTINVMSRRAAIEWLLAGRAEIAVVSTAQNHSELEFRPFLEDQIVLIAPAGHPWADGRTVSPEDLLEMPFIMREQTAGSYQVLAEGLAACGHNVDQIQTVLTLSNAEAIEMSVEVGIGVAFVSRVVAERRLAVGRIAEVPVRGMALTRTIHMVRHQRYAQTPLQRAFWDFAFDPANAGIRQMGLEYAAV